MDDFFNNKNTNNLCKMSYNIEGKEDGRYCIIKTDGKISYERKCVSDSDCNYCIDDPSDKTKKICSNTAKECKNHSDCLVIKESFEEIYKRKTTEFKEEVRQWLNTILKNNCKETNLLKTKLKIKSYEDINDILGNTDLRLYNNKTGHLFLEDEFLNNKYYNEILVKRANDNRNPFRILDKNTDLKYGIMKIIIKKSNKYLL